MQIRLLIGCREATLATALCADLVSASDGKIAAEATEIPAVLHRAAATQPDVLMLEHISGQEQRTWKVLSQLERLSPGTPVLLLCDDDTHATILGSIQRGAKGCVLRSGDAAVYAKAVAAVHQGEPWFGRTALLEALCCQMAAERASAFELLDEHKLLTAREREILTLAGSALSNKEIARQLNISDKTVKTHLHHIYVKLQKRGRYKLLMPNAAALSHSRL